MKSSSSIVDRIREKKVRQIPKWLFTLKYILNWVFYAVCILLGGAAFSVILFSVQQTDFYLIDHLSHSNWELILGLLPFFWIIILLIFLVLAYIVVRRSKRGYKFNWLLLLGLSTAASILLGTIFFIGGGAYKLESLFIENVKNYQSVHDNKLRLWMQPENGLLAGTVNSVNENTLILDDFYGYIWKVDYGNAIIPQSLDLSAGQKIKLIGRISSPDFFIATEIRPWNGNFSRPNSQRKGLQKKNSDPQ